MFSLVGFTESQDSASLVNVAALADPHIRVSGDDISVPAQISNVGAVYAIGASTTRAQLVSPSIRRRYPFEIIPVEAAAEPADPVKFLPFLQNPIALDPDESLNAQAAEGGAGANQSTVLVWLTDGPIQPVTGAEIFTIRATNTSTLTAYAWTNGALTFNDTLPAGEYAVVGMQASSAGLLAARLVFSQYPWRPGVIAADTNTELGSPSFRFGAMGEFGRFTHTTPPTVDFLSISADTSQTVHLDLVMVGGRLAGQGRM